MTDITATVQNNNTVVGSISQGNQPQVVRVTVPGPKGPAGEAAQTFSGLSDVDVTNLADGAMIQYDGNTQKFKATNEIDTDTGEIRLNGGAF